MNLGGVDVTFFNVFGLTRYVARVERSVTRDFYKSYLRVTYLFM